MIKEKLWQYALLTEILTEHLKNKTDKYGGVKVSTGILNFDKRAAVRNRFKIRNLNINNNSKVAYAA